MPHEIHKHMEMPQPQELQEKSIENPDGTVDKVTITLLTGEKIKRFHFTIANEELNHRQSFQLPLPYLPLAILFLNNPEEYYKTMDNSIYQKVITLRHAINKTRPPHKDTGVLTKTKLGYRFKPFDLPPNLKNENIRRTKEIIIIHELQFYFIPDDKIVFLNDAKIELTPQETKLLLLLTINPYAPVSKIEIEKFVWNNKPVKSGNFRRLITDIRRKFQEKQNGASFIARININSSNQAAYVLTSNAIDMELHRKAVLKSLKDIEPQKLQEANLKYYPTEQTAIRNNRIIALTEIETKIMNLFMSDPNKIFTSEEIKFAGWGNINTLDTTFWSKISILRRKLNAATDLDIKLIIGQYGNGYSLLSPYRKS
jgi:DNA-binding response OmpR family regulator